MQIALGLSLVLMSLLFISCSGSSADEGILSPEEMESTHLEMDFASSGELAAQAEAILKMLTGEDYYFEVICVPMGEANRQFALS